MAQLYLPDFFQTCEETLRFAITLIIGQTWNHSTLTRDVFDDIRIDIASTILLQRSEEIQNAADVLAQDRTCLIVGDSGCGKSAIAKMTGAQKYARVIALPWEGFDSGRQSTLEHFLGLHAFTARGSAFKSVLV